MNMWHVRNQYIIIIMTLIKSNIKAYMSSCSADGPVQHIVILKTRERKIILVKRTDGSEYSNGGATCSIYAGLSPRTKRCVALKLSKLYTVSPLNCI